MRLWRKVIQKHPVALSLAEAYGKPAESTRIKDVKEEPGYGVHAFVDGLEVYAGNTRLMNREGILYAQTEKTELPFMWLLTESMRDTY